LFIETKVELFKMNYKSINKLLLTFTLIICFKTIVFSQNNNSISSTAFLATAKTKSTVLRQQIKVDVLKSTRYALPFLEKVNFQTQTDRFQLQRQEYQSRASFNGFEEIKREKQWHQANIKTEEAEQDVLFQDILLDRYNLLVEYKYALNALNLYRRIYLVFKDKRDVLQKMAKLTTDFSIEDLIKAEESAFQYQQKISEKENLIYRLNQYAQLIFNSKDSFSLDTSNWIPLSNLRDFATNLPQNARKNALLTHQEAKINLVQATYDVEKASTKKILDFGQLKYGARPSNVLQTELSIGVGFVVPYRGSSKTILNKLNFKQLEEKNKLQDIQEDLAIQLFNAQKELETTFKEYDLTQKQINESQTLYSLDHYMNMQGGSPIVMLRMQELVLQRQARLIDLEHDAFVQYLKILSWSGKMAALPLQNYLSANFEGF
jgi:hypothetical protein